MISWRQLLDHGLSAEAIRHRVRIGRLYPIWPGVYSVGRREVSRLGMWMAAVLTCGPGAVLSHGSAGALWEFGNERGAIEVSVPYARSPRRRGLRVYRRRVLRATDTTEHRSIPVTTPTCTIVDLAPRLAPRKLEGAISEMDSLDLITPPALRTELEAYGGWTGAPAVRRILDRRTFRLTRSELERRFLPLARRAGLGIPQTRVWLNGFEVDFHWPDLGLVVETDGLRYHRTPAQQARDRLRDQAHTAAGLTPMRFTHEQVAYEPEHVVRTLAAVAVRLRSGAAATA